MKIIKGNLLFHVLVLIFLITPSMTQVTFNNACYRINHNLNINAPFLFTSPNYANRYPVGTNCKWHFVTAPNQRINVQCNDVVIGPDPNCVDRLVVSYNGDVNLNDGAVYCGAGTMNVVSNNNALTIATISVLTTGRLSCVAYAIAGAGPNPIPTTTTTTTTTTTLKPPLPNNQTCDCGWKQQRRIVGGVQTGVNEFPFMAGLIKRGVPTVYCGCVIISKQHVLTAAHCVLNIHVADLSVLVGDHDIVKPTEAPDVDLIPVMNVRSHPNYNSINQENDISVLTLIKTLPTSMNIGPICLPYYYTGNVDNVPVVILGWGTTEFSGPTSDYLQSANSLVVPYEKCQAAWSNNVIRSSQICIYQEGKDACQFDSGGPIIMWDWYVQRYYLLGLISYGKGCGSLSPSVNTRVSSFLTWIERETSTTFCKK